MLKITDVEKRGGRIIITREAISEEIAGVNAASCSHTAMLS